MVQTKYIDVPIWNANHKRVKVIIQEATTFDKNIVWTYLTTIVKEKKNAL